MPNKTVLTTKAIEALKPGEIMWDTRVLGFGVKRTAKGATAFLNYQERAAAKYKRVTLGTVPPQPVDLLRQEAAKLKLQVAAGEDPAAARATPKQRKDEPTLASSLALWLDHPHGWAPRTRTGYKRLIDRYVATDDGAIFISDQKRTTLISIVDEARAKSPSTAAALHRMFGSFLSWADHRGLIEIRLPRARHVAPAVPPRERVMTDQEIRGPWHAAARLTPLTALAGRLVLATAIRSGALTKLRREWIHNDALRFPAGAMKGGRPFTIPLTNFANALVEPLRARTGAVFSDLPEADDSERLKQALPHWRLLAGLPKGDDLRLHDVRRALGTWAARQGYSDKAREAALAHATADSKLESVYNLHQYESEAAVVLKAWQERIEQVVA